MESVRQLLNNRVRPKPGDSNGILATKLAPVRHAFTGSHLRISLPVLSHVRRYHRLSGF